MVKKIQIIDIMADAPIYEEIEPIFLHFTKKENVKKIA
jgi:hypothetical protein